MFDTQSREGVGRSSFKISRNAKGGFGGYEIKVYCENPVVATNVGLQIDDQLLANIRAGEDFHKVAVEGFESAPDIPAEVTQAAVNRETGGAGDGVTDIDPETGEPIDSADGIPEAPFN